MNQKNVILRLIYLGILLIGFILNFIFIFIDIKIFTYGALIYLTFAVIGFLVLKIIHALSATYVCSNCQKSFHPRFFADAFGLKTRQNEKELTCPFCKQKVLCKEKANDGE
jgi:DNA-directed RNA polymerase subunit RPC12/RpoP